MQDMGQADFGPGWEIEEMHAVLMLVAVALPGIDVGWIQLPDGSYEYIIQIEPEMLERLREGHDLRSDLPPALRNVSRYQIRVGTAPLPHEGIPPELVGQPARPVDAMANAPLPSVDGPFFELSRQERPGPGPEQEPETPIVELAEEKSGPQFPTVDQVIDRFGAPLMEPVVPVPKAADVVIAPAAAEPKPDPAPQPFAAPNFSKPLVEQTAVFDRKPQVEEAPAEPVDESTETTVQPSLVGKPPVAEEPTPKPWWALSLALIGLFASLGGNAYMAWVTWGTRVRYRTLLTKTGGQAPRAT